MSLASSLKNEKFARLLRFGVVGGAATVLYYALALVCVRVGMGVEEAHIVAFLVSIVASYFGQKIFTFRIRGEHQRNAPRFIIATACIAAIQLLLVSGLRAAGLDPAVIFAISSVYYPVASLVTHSIWTFRRSISERSAPITSEVIKGGNRKRRLSRPS